MIRFILLCLFICTSVSARDAKEIKVASYNLRYNNAQDGVNAWPNRKENVKALIRYHDFDIFGTQEGLIGQLKDLNTLMPEYACSGAGRDDGAESGEHSAVFYKKERFKVLGSGNFWLSENPDKPGLGWDARCCNRICSWVQFKDLKTKKVFYFFNVHFDHEGVVARKESGTLMMNRIKEIAGNSPVICTGDFNSTPETDQIRTMQTFLRDSYIASETPPYGPVGTFNDFIFDAPLDERIDYVFVSQQFTVLKYAVLTDAKDQRYPSDHLPVVVDLKL